MTKLMDAARALRWMLDERAARGDVLAAEELQELSRLPGLVQVTRVEHASNVSKTMEGDDRGHHRAGDVRGAMKRLRSAYDRLVIEVSDAGVGGRRQQVSPSGNGKGAGDPRVAVGLDGWDLRDKESSESGKRVGRPAVRKANERPSSKPGASVVDKEAMGVVDSRMLRNIDKKIRRLAIEIEELILSGEAGEGKREAAGSGEAVSLISIMRCSGCGTFIRGREEGSEGSGGKVKKYCPWCGAMLTAPGE